MNVCGTSLAYQGSIAVLSLCIKGCDAWRKKFERVKVSNRTQKVTPSKRLAHREQKSPFQTNVYVSMLEVTVYHMKVLNFPGEFKHILLGIFRKFYFTPQLRFSTILADSKALTDRNKNLLSESCSINRLFSPASVCFTNVDLNLPNFSVPLVSLRH